MFNEHQGHFGPPTRLTMNMMKMMPSNPAAETVAADKAPEIEAAIVRAEKAKARMMRTSAPKGDWILLMMDIAFFHQPPQTG